MSPLDKIAATAPDHIWLDLGEETHLVDDGTTFKDLGGVTWSEDNATGQGIKYVRATPPAATPAAPGEVMDALADFLEAQDALDNREYQGINGEDYSTLMRRRNSARAALDAALAHPAPVAAPAHPPRVTALDVDNLSQAVGQAEEIDGNLRSIRSRLDALAAPAPASEAVARIDKLIAALRHDLTYDAEWRDKTICVFEPDEDYQNWASTVYLSVPLSAKDKSVGAAFDRYIERLLDQDVPTEFDPLLEALSEHDDPCEDVADAISRVAALRAEIEYLRPFFLRAQAEEEAEAQRQGAQYWQDQANSVCPRCKELKGERVTLPGYPPMHCMACGFDWTPSTPGDSADAPVQQAGEYPPLPAREDRPALNAIPYRVYTEAQMRAYVDADRAALKGEQPAQPSGSERGEV